MFDSWYAFQVSAKRRLSAVGTIAVAVLMFLIANTGRATQVDEPFCEFVPPASIANGKTIVLLSGDEEYRSEEAMPMLGKILSQRHGFHCYVLFAINPETGEIDPNNQRNIPRMDLLDRADLVIMSWRFRNPPDEDMKHFVDYFKRGKPFIGLRTSTHAFQFTKEMDSRFSEYSFNSREWPGGFGKQVLGETWISHHGNHGSESTRGVVNPDAADHPILRGVKNVWGPTDVYGVRDLPEDALILERGQILKGMSQDSPPADDPRNDPMMPLVWVRELPVEGSDHLQRIVTTTMGAATDFEVGDLRRLIINASYWCLGMEDKIDANANVDVVGEFKPTPFGFNKFIPGRHPSDYDLKSGDGEQHPQAARIDGTEYGWETMTADDFENVNCDDDTWTWRDDGSLHCKGTPVGVLRSKVPYTNFELVLEWRHLRNAGNSGVFVWSPLASLERIKPGQLPEGIECQVLDHGYTAQYEQSSGKKADWFTTNGDVFPVGASKLTPFPPLSPNGVRSFPSSNHSHGFGEWNHYYIRAINGEVRLWVNGHEVSGGMDASPATGYMALESEGSPIEFKNIRIRTLK